MSKHLITLITKLKKDFIFIQEINGHENKLLSRVQLPKNALDKEFAYPTDKFGITM